MKSTAKPVINRLALVARNLILSYEISQVFNTEESRDEKPHISRASTFKSLSATRFRKQHLPIKGIFQRSNAKTIFGAYISWRKLRS